MSAMMIPQRYAANDNLTRDAQRVYDEAFYTAASDIC